MSKGLIFAVKVYKSLHKIGKLRLSKPPKMPPESPQATQSNAKQHPNPKHRKAKTKRTQSPLESSQTY